MKATVEHDPGDYICTGHESITLLLENLLETEKAVSLSRDFIYQIAPRSLDIRKRSDRQTGSPLTFCSLSLATVLEDANRRVGTVNLSVVP
jgi:hypothetical protein